MDMMTVTVLNCIAMEVQNFTFLIHVRAKVYAGLTVTVLNCIATEVLNFTNLICVSKSTGFTIHNIIDQPLNLIIVFCYMKLDQCFDMSTSLLPRHTLVQYSA